MNAGYQDDEIPFNSRENSALEATAGTDSLVVEGTHYTPLVGGDCLEHEPSEDHHDKDVDITWLVDYFRRLLGRSDCGPVLVNYNVLLMVILSFGYGVAESLWTDTILVVYLKDVSRDGNEFIGFMELANGVALLVAALPIGYLADTYSISLIIRCGGVLLLLAAGLDTFLVIWRGCDEGEAAISEFSRKDKATWIALILFAECL